jgi:hypothetical protein
MKQALDRPSPFQGRADTEHLARGRQRPRRNALEKQIVAIAQRIFK